MLSNVQYLHFTGLPVEYEINLVKNNLRLRPLSTKELHLPAYKEFINAPVPFTINKNILRYTEPSDDVDLMADLYQYIWNLLFIKPPLLDKKHRPHICIPGGPFIVLSKARATVTRKKKFVAAHCEYYEPCDKGGVMYEKRGLADWYRDPLSGTGWQAPNRRRRDLIYTIKSFRIFSFDFETRPSDATPVMVCMTEQNISTGEVSLFREDIGPRCHITFFRGLIDFVASSSVGATSVVLGFNSSRFDNIFLADAMAHLTQEDRDKIKTIKYMESSSRIVELVICGKRNQCMYFRDVLLYFPVGTRASLAVMARNLLGDKEQKSECSLEEMEIVANLIIDHPNEAATHPLYEKELLYCRQDTRVLFGLAAHIGKVFTSMEGPRQFYLEIKPHIIPPYYAFLIWFFTLPQAAKSFLLFVQPEYTPELGKFYAISNLHAARFVKTSIYGGRTLCVTVGQIIRNLVSTDICSEYPSAMACPLPYGRASYASINWINQMNKFLRDDPLWEHPEGFAYCNYVRPFVAYVAFSKKRALMTHEHNDSSSYSHRADQLLPFIPYRRVNHAYISDPFKKATADVGSLEWLADTNGQTLHGVYTAIDIYHMRRLGFSVHITTNYRTIVWEKWSTRLGSIFQQVYLIKYQAKKSGDPALELLAKIIMNSGIGKFAQRINPECSFDGHTYIKDASAVKINRTLYQINAFCMSASRLINQGHQSLTCKGEYLPDYNWEPAEGNLLNDVVYADTDNIIYRANNLGPIKAAMDKWQLLPSQHLASFNLSNMTFRFSLEFEEWHKDKVTGKPCKCPNRDKSPYGPDITPSSALFFGRKSYVMMCELCGAIRLKAKGHNQAGLVPEDFACIFNDGLDRDYFLRGENGRNDAMSVTRRLFRYIYPFINEDELLNLTSGARFTFKITLPRTGQISIRPSSIERAYNAFIPSMQRRCNTCFVLVHK